MAEVQLSYTQMVFDEFALSFHVYINETYNPVQELRVGRWGRFNELWQCLLYTAQYFRSINPFNSQAERESKCSEMLPTMSTLTW